MDTVAAYTLQQQDFAGIRRWLPSGAGKSRFRLLRFGLPLLAVVALAGLPRVPLSLAGSAVVAGAAAVAGLAARHSRPMVLPWVTIAAAPVSVLATLTGSAAAAEDVLAWLLVETAFMVLLLVQVVRAQSVRWGIHGSVLMAAIVVSTLRVTVSARASPVPAEVGGLACCWFILAAGGLAAGLYLRHLGEQRQWAVTSACREQRLRLAGEVHDRVGHEITGIVLEAQAARLDSRGPDESAAALRRIEEAGLRALESMDRTVRLLGEAAAPAVSMSELPVQLEVSELAGRFAAATLARVDLVEEGLGELSPEVMGIVQRVLLESLTNVRRHAPSAELVRVEVRRSGDELVVAVTDDGHGPCGRLRFGRRRPGGSGLAGLAACIHASGGRLQAGPVERGGWAVRVVLPVDP